VLQTDGSLKYRTQKSPKIPHLCTIAQLCRAVYLQQRHVSTIDKKAVEQQYLFHVSSQYGELGQLKPRSVWLLWAPQQISVGSRLAVITAATSLTRCQPNFARCLAVCWAGTLYIHFWGLLPLTQFCPVQNHFTSKSCVPILAALLDGTPAAGVSQTLRRGTRNGITKLSQMAPPIFGWVAIMLVSAHILVQSSTLLMVIQLFCIAQLTKSRESLYFTLCIKTQLMRH